MTVARGGIRVGADRPDRLDALGFAGARAGLVTNDAALTSDCRPVRSALIRAGVRLERLFSPEHGLSAQGEDGAAQTDGRDELTGLPVTSLYGERLAPRADDLTGLDVLLVDLPDVGCRFYTYPWTLSHVLESCATAGVPVVVLDRPNPLGRAVEGPLLDEGGCSSFVGRWRMPVRHGLTLGELALLWRREGRVDTRVEVVGVEGWTGEHAPTTGRPWVPPSPAMASSDAAALYPGLGLLEGVNVSEGRGTALPFRVAGAPWIDAVALADALAALGLPGVAMTPYHFTPWQGRYRGEACHGVLATITDPRSLRPVATGAALIRTVAGLWPDRLRPAPYPTSANPTGERHLDLLLGVRDSLDAVVAGTLDLSAPGWSEHVDGVRLY